MSSGTQPDSPVGGDGVETGADSSADGRTGVLLPESGSESGQDDSGDLRARLVDLIRQPHPGPVSTPTVAYAGAVADAILADGFVRVSVDDDLTQRYERLQGIADRVGFFAKASALVLVEGPSVMSKGGSNWDRAGLWWAVVSELLWRNQPVAVAPPTVVKKWAAGKGNADKAAVAVGVARLWDQFECESDNEADALALATMGAQKLGLPVPSRAHHADALAKVAWPDLADLEVSR